MLEFGLHRYQASPISIELSIIANFLINNYWTFRESANRSRSGSVRLNDTPVKYV